MVFPRNKGTFLRDFHTGGFLPPLTVEFGAMRREGFCFIFTSAEPSLSRYDVIASRCRARKPSLFKGGRRKREALLGFPPLKREG